MRVGLARNRYGILVPDGSAEERARIVAMLRRRARVQVDGEAASAISDAADAIEAGKAI